VGRSYILTGIVPAIMTEFSADKSKKGADAKRSAVTPGSAKGSGVASPVNPAGVPLALVNPAAAAAGG